MTRPEKAGRDLGRAIIEMVHLMYQNNTARRQKMLFEVAILETPSKKDFEEHGQLEKLIFGPKPVVANDAQSAAVSAVLDNADKIKVDRSRMEVQVRPFK